MLDHLRAADQIVLFPRLGNLLLQSYVLVVDPRCYICYVEIQMALGKLNAFRGRVNPINFADTNSPQTLRE